MQVSLLSFVVPAHDEEESLPVLCTEIRAAGRALACPYEIVVVDDGSTDGTSAWLDAEAAEHEDLRVLHQSNRGQSAALFAGLRAARGDVIVTLDADLQNDPADTPRLLEALASCDLVCGVRRRRRDSLAKRLGSRIGNGFRRWILKDRFRDVGCSLKAWRRPVAQRLRPFHGYHRFIPILAEAEGFRVAEVEVAHRERSHGRTHYGNLGRGLRGLADVFGVAWWRRRAIPVEEPSGSPERGS